MAVAVGVAVPGQGRDACLEAEVDSGGGEAGAHDDWRVGRRGHQTPALWVEAPDEGAGAEARNGARWRQEGNPVTGRRQAGVRDTQAAAMAPAIVDEDSMAPEVVGAPAGLAGDQPLHARGLRYLEA